MHRRERGAPKSFDQYRFGRDAAWQDVSPARLGLTDLIAGVSSAGEDDASGACISPQHDSMVQPRAQHRRWSSEVLRCAQDDDGVGRTGRVAL